jgi:hypothetical protein
MSGLADSLEDMLRRWDTSHWQKLAVGSVLATYVLLMVVFASSGGGFSNCDMTYGGTQINGQNSVSASTFDESKQYVLGEVARFGDYMHCLARFNAF